MIYLRAHHGFCILNFKGKGYSKAFVDNMEKVIERLAKNEPLTIIEGSDDLCAFCPHNINGQCESNKPSVYDSNVQALLEKSISDWNSFSEQLIPYNNENLEWICHNCKWLPLCLEIVRSKEKEQA